MNPLIEDLFKDILKLKSSGTETEKDLQYLLIYYSEILDAAIIDAYNVGHHCGRNSVIQANN
jgi:hypothetical protein